MKFADLLPQVLKPIAKAVAVFVTTWIVAGAAWLASVSGVDIPVEPGVVESTVLSLLLAVVTYLTTNLDD